jgi:radical SAM superfamily enzyme YgiQ (UPF0313 family)
MHVLLLASPTSWYTSLRPVYPLGLASIATVLIRRLGATVDVADLNTAKNPWASLKSILSAKRYDAVGIGWRNYIFYGVSQYPFFARTVKETRVLQPSALITAGGPGFSLLAQPTMRRLPEIDFGVIGHGEEAVPAILEGRHANLPGLLLKKIPFYH